MTKAFWRKTFAVASTGLLLAACGNGDETADPDEEVDGGTEESSETDSEETAGELTTLTVGATTTPHGEILEFVVPRLEEEGIELDIVTYTDYPLINQALDAGDLDANYFQHIPYFEGEIEANGYDLYNAGGIHIEPIGAYSQRHDSLEDLPEGADIYISSNVPDWGRILEILANAELITLDESVDVTEADFDDIIENERNLNFEADFDPALTPTLLENDEADVVFINSNFAVDHGLNPIEDSIAIQEIDADSPYANIIAVRSEDADSEAIATLVEILREQETQNYILDTWGGSVVPVGAE